MKKENNEELDLRRFLIGIINEDIEKMRDDELKLIYKIAEKLVAGR